MNQRQRLLGPMVITLSVSLLFLAVARQRKPVDQPAENKLAREVEIKFEEGTLVLHDDPLFLAGSKSAPMVSERRWWGLKILSYSRWEITKHVRPGG